MLSVRIPNWLRVLIHGYFFMVAIATSYAPVPVKPVESATPFGKFLAMFTLKVQDKHKHCPHPIHLSPCSAEQKIIA